MKISCKLVFIILLSILIGFNTINIYAQTNVNTTYEIKVKDLLDSSYKIITEGTDMPGNCDVILLDIKKKNLISISKDKANAYYNELPIIGYNLDGIYFIYSDFEHKLKEIAYSKENIIRSILGFVLSMLLIGYILNQDKIKEFLE